MAIEQLLGKITPAKFLENYFQKLPLAMKETARPYVELVDWSRIAAILQRPGAEMLVARGGKPYKGPAPQTLAQAKELHDRGHTLFMKRVEEFDSAIATLATQFRQEFNAPVDVHLFCTPREQHGFGWHYDAEDVFILQTQGSKHYSLRKNTVNPWPTLATMPSNMTYEREIMPVMNCVLSAGDWLYIPAGYWHIASTADDSSMSLSVGVLSRTALDVLDLVRQAALDSLYWRQRLPVTGTLAASSPDELKQQYRTLLEQLAERLRADLLSEQLLNTLLSTQHAQSAGGGRWLSRGECVDRAVDSALISGPLG